MSRALQADAEDRVQPGEGDSPDSMDSLQHVRDAAWAILEKMSFPPIGVARSIRDGGHDDIQYIIKEMEAIEEIGAIKEQQRLHALHANTVRSFRTAAVSSTVSGVTNRSQGQTSGRWRDENREESHHDQRERQGACEKKYMKRKTQHAADEAKMEGIVECKEAVEAISGVSTEILEAR